MAVKGMRVEIGRGRRILLAFKRQYVASKSNMSSA
jgi:hypothetical protein